MSARLGNPHLGGTIARCGPGPGDAQGACLVAEYATRAPRAGAGADTTFAELDDRVHDVSDGALDAPRRLLAPAHPTTVSTVSISSSWSTSLRRCSQWGGMHMWVPSSSADSSMKKPSPAE